MRRRPGGVLLTAERSGGAAALIAMVIVCLFSAAAQASQPVVNRIVPRGAQRGADVEVILRGERLADAQEILFDRPGVEVLKLDAADEGTVRATLRIASDCPPGMVGFRLRTASGVSNLRLFSIGALAELNEQEPNNTLAAAQRIELNRTINGVADNEDQDVFTFEAKAGDRVTAEVEGIRLGTAFFDPSVAILDAEGFELATCDDAALLRQDCFVSVVIPKDGLYAVTVRECSFAGNGDFAYRLHVGAFPRPTAMLPAGGRPGETLRTTLLGDVEGPREIELTVPTVLSCAALPGGMYPRHVIGVHVSDDRGITPSPVHLVVSDLDNLIEIEPNNRGEEATTCSPPIALNGVLSEPGDRDCFRFTARQNETYQIVAYARQIRSPLDAVIRVNQVGRGQIAANDDTNGPDPVLEFRAPADGEYVVVIEDHLGRGGVDFVYRIEIAPAPVRVTPLLPRLQEQVVVPRGGRMAAIVQAVRTGFGGDLVTSMRGLPEGVTLHAPRLHASVNQVPVVFEATADAPLAGALASLTLAQPSEEGSIAGDYRQDIELVLGQNNVVMMAQTVDRLPVVVAEPAPFSLEVIEPKAPLVQNGLMDLRVRITRVEGFDGPVRLRVPFTPPGVGASNSVTIPQGQTEATIPFNANGNAPTRDWPLVVVGETGGRRGPIRVSSQLATLRVAPPYVSVEPQPVSVEQGARTTMFMKVVRRAPFDGSLTLALEGLPHRVTSEPAELTPDVNEFTFTIITQPDSPAGRHTSPFCRAVVMVEGEPVIHRLPAGEIRIDVPLPPKSDAPPPPPPPPPPAADPAAPVVKPLSRLEQLRQQEEQRRKREQSPPPAAPPKQEGGGDAA
ncbi:MAG: peptidase [Phycisphaeraceae bacterium]|nr:hypothetical protein [Phycisphaerales bacterium]QOJ18177.1 MAG: peptidase [Phycisphaeraceae bacterium]